VSSVSTSGGLSAGRLVMTSVLALIGILGIITGLLYLFTAKALPSAMTGHVHSGHHLVRAGVSILIGLAFLGGAWLARSGSAAPGA
jgi:hypothetical protein